jgi:hypothetical protein
MSTEEGNGLSAFTLDERISKINHMFQEYDIHKGDIVG